MKNQIYNVGLSNANLSKLINQSYLTMATCSRADIAMAKYFEIAGSYSTIFLPVPRLLLRFILCIVVKFIELVSIIV